MSFWSPRNEGASMVSFPIRTQLVYYRDKLKVLRGLILKVARIFWRNEYTLMQWLEIWLEWNMDREHLKAQFIFLAQNTYYYNYNLVVFAKPFFQNANQFPVLVILRTDKVNVPSYIFLMKRFGHIILYCAWQLEIVGKLLIYKINQNIWIYLFINGN